MCVGCWHSPNLASRRPRWLRYRRGTILTPAHLSTQIGTTTLPPRICLPKSLLLLPPPIWLPKSPLLRYSRSPDITLCDWMGSKHQLTLPPRICLAKSPLPCSVSNRTILTWFVLALLVVIKEMPDIILVVCNKLLPFAHQRKTVSWLEEDVVNWCLECDWVVHWGQRAWEFGCDWYFPPSPLPSLTTRDVGTRRCHLGISIRSARTGG